MNILTLVFLILSSFTSEPLEEIAAIKLGRTADGEIYIMEWLKPKYFSDTCEMYQTILPYIQKRCFTKKEKENPKKKKPSGLNL